MFCTSYIADVICTDLTRPSTQERARPDEERSRQEALQRARADEEAAAMMRRQEERLAKTGALAWCKRSPLTAGASQGFRRAVVREDTQHGLEMVMEAERVPVLRAALDTAKDR
ncbi:unnamed protein product [Symbiodinium sp. KB8]|nr:unnamed protein product [Symbiodinium sp. KB8]